MYIYIYIYIYDSDESIDGLNKRNLICSRNKSWYSWLWIYQFANTFFSSVNCTSIQFIKLKRIFNQTENNLTD